MSHDVVDFNVVTRQGERCFSTALWSIFTDERKFPGKWVFSVFLCTSARVHDVMTRCTPSIVIPAEIIQNLIMNQNFQVPRRQVHRNWGRGRPGERVLGGGAADRGARPGPQVVGQRRRLRLLQHELRRRPRRARLLRCV